jgi:4-carboxymuconolactone decarboxylase
MEMNRFEKGMKKLSEVDGAAGEHVINALNNIAPDLGKYIVEFAFGDIYCRDNLNLEEREMITLASLLTQGGCENQLEVHINGALNVGITPLKVTEVFLQCIPYTGFPRVLNAIGVAKKVFQSRNVSIENTIS